MKLLSTLLINRHPKTVICLTTALFLGFAANQAQAQDALVPLNRDIYHLIDRYQIKYNDSVPEFHTGLRPYRRRDVAKLADAVANDEATIVYSLTDTAQAAPADLSKADKFNIRYLIRDNWQWSKYGNETNESRKPFLKHFYRNQTDLYHVETEDFRLRVNPVIHFMGGKDQDDQLERTVYINTRGVQLEGDIGRKVGFYTVVTENQMSAPGYVNARVARDKSLPGEGFYKGFGSNEKSRGYDFFNARGYITAQLIKQIDVQLGHDRNFIGNGYRSLLLSDYSAPYFFAKINTRVWKLHYMNLFTELTASRDNARGDNLYPKKYMTLHHLSINLTPKLNVGFFESVTFARGAGRYELQYLNPIIFYRSIEHNLGSPDNAMLGFDFRWNVFNTAQFYGQIMLDEFLISEIRARNGWWANKQGFQLGAKYIDAAGIKNLDLQAEFNFIRPYSYTHNAREEGVTEHHGSYTHYLQPLAHPIGANLRELIGIVRYQPLPRLMLTAKGIYTQYGADTLNSNWGTNVLLDYTTREQTYGNKAGQGVRVNQLYLDLTATWQLRQNVFIDATFIRRDASAAVASVSRATNIATLGLRWNIDRRTFEF